MSVNKYLPHVFVLPEDDANRQLANGFQIELRETRRMQILDVAGGWRGVLDRFLADHVPGMDQFARRLMVLLIDFDQRSDRLGTIKDAIPERLKDRVFVLGAWSEPEKLRPSLGSYETIGAAMAKDCRENTEVTWSNDLLRHNASELERLQKSVRPILFGGG